MEKKECLLFCFQLRQKSMTQKQLEVFRSACGHTPRQFSQLQAGSKAGSLASCRQAAKQAVQLAAGRQQSRQFSQLQAGSKAGSLASCRQAAKQAVQLAAGRQQSRQFSQLQAGSKAGSRAAELPAFGVRSNAVMHFSNTDLLPACLLACLQLAKLLLVCSHYQK